MHAQFKNIMNTHNKRIINPPKDTIARTVQENTNAYLTKNG